MFWRFGGYANISSLDAILDKPDVTLEDLLDESDLIQELKQQNSKLIEFLREEPVLDKLLRYVTADKALEPPSSSLDDPDDRAATGISFFKKTKSRSRSKSVNKNSLPDEDEDEDRNEAQRKRYAYVACEVLSSDVWSITEAIVEYQDQLRRFWDYMKRPAPLDALQAGYFTKVNDSLFDKKTEEMLSFFKSLDNIIPQMLQHVECPMVMDLLLKIVTLEKLDGGQGTVDWLQSQNLIPILLSYLSNRHPLATQTAAGDFLKAIITISANATTQDQTVIGPNELTRQLVSEPCISTLIQDMLQGGNPLTVGVGIVIEVIRKNNSDYDLDNQVGPEPKSSDPIFLGTLLRQFARHVPDFMRLVRNPSAKKPALKAAFGSKIEPLGFDRFKTCELMAELLHCSNMGLLNERGAEADVRVRDAERERLKSEGKLMAEHTPEIGQDPFASSVDSHGFHHAQRPEDDLSGSPEEIKRLEVQNASDEDGFEKVAAPDADTLPDEVTFDDFNEKLEEADLPPLTKSVTPSSLHHVAEQSENTDQPETPDQAPESGDSSHASPSTPSAVQQKVNELHLSSPEQTRDEPSEDGKRRVSLLTRQLQEQMQESESEMSEPSGDSKPTVTASEDVDMLSHPEDKPAPLFASKSPSKNTEPERGSLHVDEERDSPSQSTATLLPPQFPTGEADERQSWEADIDGTPVVGDLLKIMFVEHQVVPTILDFFFRFPWNNFLHNVVYDVVQQVFNGSFERGYNRTLAIDLFCQSRCTDLTSTEDITQRILDGQAASDQSQQEKGMRLGYMGHLTLIAEEVLKLHDRQPARFLGEQILERVNREAWVRYLESTLSETRDRDNAVLGGVKPENMHPRQMDMGGMEQGFGNSNALSDAGLSGVPADSMALHESGDGSGYSISGGSGGAGLLSGFGNGDDDEDMEDNLNSHDDGIDADERLEKAVSDDEQFSTSPIAAPPAPLSIAPSRARARLAERLAARKKEREESDQPFESYAYGDPDIEDSSALARASEVPAEPLTNLLNLNFGDDGDVFDDRQDRGHSGFRVSGMRLHGATDVSDRTKHVFSSFDDGLDTSSSSSTSGSDLDSDGDGTDHASRAKNRDDGDGGDGTPGELKRRPSTTEAKYRIPLDEDDDDLDLNFTLGSTSSLSQQTQNAAGGSGSSSDLARSRGGGGSGMMMQYGGATTTLTTTEEVQQNQFPSDTIGQFGDSSEEEVEEEIGGTESDSSDEGDIVEIKPRRKS